MQDTLSLSTEASRIVAEEHWARKGNVDLAMSRKYSPEAQKNGCRGVLFLVHGSSQAARTSVDLEAPGHGEYSTMNYSLASAGTSGRWTMRAMDGRAAPPATRRSATAWRI